MPLVIADARVAFVSRAPAVYLEFFADAEIRPARVCFAVDKLPLGALVEVECTAYVK